VHTKLKKDSHCISDKLYRPYFTVTRLLSTTCFSKVFYLYIYFENRNGIKVVSKLYIIQNRIVL